MLKPLYSSIISCSFISNQLGTNSPRMHQYCLGVVFTMNTRRQLTGKFTDVTIIYCKCIHDIKKQQITLIIADKHGTYTRQVVLSVSNRKICPATRSYMILRTSQDVFTITMQLKSNDLADYGISLIYDGMQYVIGCRCCMALKIQNLELSVVIKFQVMALAVILILTVC